MDENIGNIAQNKGGSGFSLFFLTSSALSVFNAWRNGNTSIQDAMKDEEFQLALEQQRRDFEGKKIAEEREFKKWILQRQREYARIEAAKKLDFELAKEDLKMFFEDWPLEISIDRINQENKKNGGIGKFYIVVGKHFVGKAKDVLAMQYDTIVDFIQHELNKHNNNIVTYRFKENSAINDGPALAYIYAMMSTRPTVVLLPRLRDKKLIISVGCWNQDSLFPFQMDACSIDIEDMRMRNSREYLLDKIEEVQLLLTSISQVLCDNHYVLESLKEPVFPILSKGYDIANKYPYLLDFAIKEYKSLLESDRVFLQDINYQKALHAQCDDEVRGILMSTINSLTK